MLAVKKSFREKSAENKVEEKPGKKSTPHNLQRISGMDDKLVRACCCSQLKNDDNKF